MAKLSRGLEFLISQTIIPIDKVSVVPASDEPPAPSPPEDRVILIGEDRVKVEVLYRPKRRREQ